MLDNYEKLQSIFESDPTHWGGAYVDGDFLVVKFVSQTPDEALALLTLENIVRGIRLVGADVSISDLKQAQTDVDEALSGDSRAVSCGPDYASSSIAVDATTADPDLLTALRQKVSSKTAIDVVPGVRRPETTSRYYDTIPYYGGNLLQLSGSVSPTPCSTGFNLAGFSDGYAYVVTAGHCYQLLSSGTRPAVSVMRSSPDRPSGVGTVWAVSTGPSGTISTRKGDLAIYRYTPIAGVANSSLGAGRVFTGDGNSPSSSFRAIIGASDLPQGYQSANIRTSGASAWIHR